MQPVLVLLLADAAAGAATPTSVFLQSGLPGAVAVVLAGVVVYLYRDMKSEITKRDTEISKRDTEIGRLQNQHATDLAELQAQRTAENALVQNQRVLDAQAFAERMLRVNEAMVTTMSSVNGSMQAVHQVQIELKGTMKEIGDDMRGRRPRS